VAPMRCRACRKGVDGRTRVRRGGRNVLRKGCVVGRVIDGVANPATANIAHEYKNEFTSPATAMAHGAKQETRR